jgi:hypothetical protein
MRLAKTSTVCSKLGAAVLEVAEYRYGFHRHPEPCRSFRAARHEFANLVRASMPILFLAATLTPHGRLILMQDDDAAAIEAELAQRLERAFARGSGHGLLQLGANEIGVALPSTLSYWREFAAQYVTAVCALPNTVRDHQKLKFQFRPASSWTSLCWLRLL